MKDMFVIKIGQIEGVINALTQPYESMTFLYSTITPIVDN